MEYENSSPVVGISVRALHWILRVTRCLGVGRRDVPCRLAVIAVAVTDDGVSLAVLRRVEGS